MSCVQPDSVKLEPYGDESRKEMLIDFKIDSTVDCEVTVYFAVTETLKSDGAFFAPQQPNNPYKIEPVKLSAGKGLSYREAMASQSRQPILDMSYFEPWGTSKLAVNSVFPNNYPVVVAISYKVPDVFPGHNIHYTYCALKRKAGSNMATQLVRQRLQTDGCVFDLHEVYGGSAADTEDNMCVICLCEERNVVILPCRHLCLCNDCATELNDQPDAKCPMCRGRAESLIKKG